MLQMLKQTTAEIILAQTNNHCRTSKCILTAGYKRPSVRRRSCLLLINYLNITDIETKNKRNQTRQKYR